MIPCMRCGKEPALLVGDVHVSGSEGSYALHLPVWMRCQCGARLHLYPVTDEITAIETIQREAIDDWNAYQNARAKADA